MDLGLKGKVFIVSGGSKGIGEGITRAICAEGGHVVIATRSAGPITDKLVAELHDQGHQVLAVFGDLSHSAKCNEVVAETVQHFGQINGIVNNAGVNDGVGLTDGPAAFRGSLLNNLTHYYDLVHYALPYLKESRGAIVNIGSKVAFTGQGNTSAYAAAKGGVHALTREWAADLLPHSIRVNAVIPSEVMTPLYETWLNKNFDDPQAQEKTITDKIPLEKRMTTKEEIAHMVVFLLSNRSGHTTGQLITVDGGYMHLDRALT